MSSLSQASAPLSAGAIYARLLSIDPDAAAAFLHGLPAQTLPTGLAILAAQTPADVQRATGVRRTFSPFSF